MGMETYITSQAAPQIQQTSNAGYDAFIFDLDGTLIDSLPDLVVVANKALQQMGFPERSRDEILSYVGNGALVLMQKACPEDTDPETVAQAFALFKSLYGEYGLSLTKPYDGVIEALQCLHAQGKKTAVLSNKFEGGVHDVMAHCFDTVEPRLIDVAHGERESEGVPRKPDPAGLLLIMKELEVEPERCIYFGDSAGDIICAHAAGVYAVGCTWGYQPKEALIQAKADALIDAPAEIMGFA